MIDSSVSWLFCSYSHMTLEQTILPKKYSIYTSGGGSRAVLLQAEA